MTDVKQLKEKTIGVFFGGQSPEHEISIITGEFILASLKKAGYNAIGVYVSKVGV
jgi:D-alanine-D-alanine ligase